MGWIQGNRDLRGLQPDQPMEMACSESGKRELGDRQVTGEIQNFFRAANLFSRLDLD